MDMEEKKSINGGEEIQNDGEIKKFCSDCKTTKTPLWRVGPDGPKSLCNACGIRYRKKRRAILGAEKKKERYSATVDDGGGGGKIGSSGGENEGLREDLKVRLKMAIERSSSIVKKQRCQRRKKLLLGEEERAAAFCLLALSSGSVSVFA